MKMTETKKAILISWAKRVAVVVSLLGAFIGSFLYINNMSEKAVAASIERDIQTEIRRLDDKFIQGKQFEEFKQLQKNNFDTINRILDKIDRDQREKFDDIDKKLGNIMKHLLKNASGEPD